MGAYFRSDLTRGLAWTLVGVGRMLARGNSAEVEVQLRGSTLSTPSATVRPIAMEVFATNKDMGRVLIRRGGETIAAGQSAVVAWETTDVEGFLRRSGARYHYVRDENGGGGGGSTLAEGDAIRLGDVHIIAVDVSLTLPTIYGLIVLSGFG